MLNPTLEAALEALREARRAERATARTLDSAHQAHQIAHGAMLRADDHVTSLVRAISDPDPACVAAAPLDGDELRRRAVRDAPQA